METIIPFLKKLQGEGLNYKITHGVKLGGNKYLKGEYIERMRNKFLVCVAIHSKVKCCSRTVINYYLFQYV